MKKEAWKDIAGFENVYQVSIIVMRLVKRWL